MSVIRNFPANVSFAGLAEVLDAIGAHTSAKLEQFSSDERTLTDELCDMFFIWGEISGTQPAVGPTISATVYKTTQQEEAAVGCDLAFTVVSPYGRKRALIQAKVYDPVDGRLRCDSKSGWAKLWGQLVLMQKKSPDLSFLLVYVPWSHLDGSNYRYGTYEQGYASGAQTTSRPSKYGVSLIPASDLIDSAGNWKNRPPVRVAQGICTPGAISFSQLLKDMITCNRGKWDPSGYGLTPHSDSEFETLIPYREVGASFAEAGERAWEEFVQNVRSVDLSE